MAETSQTRRRRPWGASSFGEVPGCPLEVGVSTSSLVARQRLLERTLVPDRLSPPIPAQQLLGSLGSIRRTSRRLPLILGITIDS